ncbi:MAG: 3-oxoacyl-[acyl-carrier-protein] synthase III C-terminal domain-containing protein [Candidatus Lernaella stagnicola]|nr:3-oxoacyl-[acyl-carrier-protein] synthase III C-terminal domain-containing protein [Candidatus Lernaella stagnicola]
MKTTTKILGVGSYIPERIISNDDALAMLENASRAYLESADLKTLTAKAAAKMEKAGSVTRHWCEEDQYSTDIARLASEKALNDAGVDAADIDLIIYTGMSKAFVEPATAHVLRHEIGARNANVIDTQDACTSFMKSMDLADSMIRTGKAETVLVAAGERTFDWADFTCKTVDELAWKFGALTIGDAAGAMVLGRTSEPVYAGNPYHMRSFHKLADGQYGTCHIGLNHKFGERYRLHSHSSRLVRAGLGLVMQLVSEVLQQPEFAGFQYDTLFVHDIGKIIETTVLPFLREAGVHVPETYRSYFPDLGNIASTSLPVALDSAIREGRIQRGNLAVYVCPAAGVQAGVLLFVY